jgi:hypothetical protein
MAEFVYSVWFSDDDALDDDQDREWVACIGIEAGNGDEAQRWGDTLARDRVSRNPAERFIRSSIELRSEVSGVTNWSSLPCVRAGQLASDDEIGW